MSNSTLVTYTKLSPNKNTPRNHVIDTITIHMVEGQLSVETLGEIFAKKSRKASSNYGIGSDGRIALYVDESDRSWCSGNPANDHRAITIEVASDKTSPYAVNSAAYNALIDLCTDIVKRNPGFKGSLKWADDSNLVGLVDKQNMTLHKWFQDTPCPGEWLHSRMGQIAKAVNVRLNEKTYSQNDIVYFKGGKDYNSSSGKTSTSNKPASLAKITKVANGSHPYHVRRVDEKLNFKPGGVYGWVDAETITT